MNRVLRSPEISEKPYVIPVQSSVVADTGDQEETFRSLDPEAGTESLPEEASDQPAGGEPDSETEAGSDPEAAAESDSDAANTDETPSDEEPAAGTDVASEDSSPGGEGEEQALPGDATEEDGEIMIGMEEVAERDAPDQSPSDPTSPEGTESEQLPASATEIESIVESRLKEFEERFQQEKEDAYHSGFEDGANEGMKQGLNQSEEEVVRFQEMVDTLTGQWKDTLRTYDTAVADLAIRIAKKIIDVEIEQNQEAVLQAVHQCLAYVEDKSKVIIRVNPDDLEAVRRHRNDWLESLESIDHLLIESEPTVARGGCVVETPIGDVDAQIEERLERLKAALLEEINRTDDGQEA